MSAQHKTDKLRSRLAKLKACTIPLPQSNVRAMHGLCKEVNVQDNTIADSPMVELLTSMQHMLEQARVRTGGVGASQDLHQLVIIVADGRFHEKESLQRVIAVSQAS